MDLTHTNWDVIVVGSGATGGAAAKKLTEDGLRVLVLEAGPPVTGKDYGSKLAIGARRVYRHLVSRRQRVQNSHPTYWTTNPDFFVDDVDNPYTTPSDKPYRWIRARRLGGRTLTWDAVTIRMSDFDFKAASYDKLGPDWPLCHADLDPHYRELERFLGIHGARDGLDQIPDGEFCGPRPMTPAEELFKARLESAYPERNVIVSRGIAARRRREPGEEVTRLSNVGSTLRSAAETGRLTLMTNCVVSRIRVSADGSKAVGVDFVDATSKQAYSMRSNAVFLCASTIETLRILMNSKSGSHQQGIGGASECLGRYVMDHLASNLYFCMPGIPPNGARYTLTGGDSFMIPRYQNLGKKTHSFPRGFGVWGGIQRLNFPHVLNKRKDNAFGFLCIRSETLPNADNAVSLNPRLTDAWGIPAAHIECEWKDIDLEIAQGAREETEAMVRAAGADVVGDLGEVFHMPLVRAQVKRMQESWSRSIPGMFVHEVGGARMGTSPKTSVVDPFCRVWEVPNVFVTDGSCWPTAGWQNPTLTEMAITRRACERAARDLGFV